jgi:hypothetical protein
VRAGSRLVSTHSSSVILLDTGVETSLDAAR